MADQRVKLSLVGRQPVMRRRMLPFRTFAELELPGEIWLLVIKNAVKREINGHASIDLPLALRQINTLLGPLGGNKSNFEDAIRDMYTGHMFTITMRGYMHFRYCQQPGTCLIASGLLALRFPRHRITHLQLVARLEPAVQHGQVIRRAILLIKCQTAITSTQQLFPSLVTIELKLIAVEGPTSTNAIPLVTGIVKAAKDLTGVKVLVYRGDRVGAPEDLKEEAAGEIAEMLRRDMIEAKVFIL